MQFVVCLIDDASTFRVVYSFNKVIPVSRHFNVILVV